MATHGHRCPMGDAPCCAEREGPGRASAVHEPARGLDHDDSATGVNRRAECALLARVLVRKPGVAVINVGFQVNCRRGMNVRERLTPSVLNRIALMDDHLRADDCRLFVYCPSDVHGSSATVAGYLHEAGDFIPSRAAVPTINGNWTHRTRIVLDRGMGYDKFQQWAEQRGIRMYIPYELTAMVANKYRAYRMVYGYNATLHPHCEMYTNQVDQLETFLNTGPLTFIKPRSGSKGNQVIAIDEQSDGLAVTHHVQKKRHREVFSTVAAAAEFIAQLTHGPRRFVIQHGVETLKYQGSSFDVRVIMLHDGSSWQWIHETRLSPAGSRVSNIAQGGRTVISEDLLYEVLGAEGAPRMLHEIKGESFGLASYLDQRYPGAVNEVAFDFVIDHSERLRLLEVNTKPGLGSLGCEVDIWEKGPEHEAIFERWVYPHVKHLAGFLRKKVADERNGLRRQFDPDARVGGHWEGSLNVG